MMYGLFCTGNDFKCKAQTFAKWPKLGCTALCKAGPHIQLSTKFDQDLRPLDVQVKLIIGHQTTSMH